MARVAVIGVGGWGKNHVRVLRELGALVAVCDVVEERAKAFAKRYDVQWYSSVNELLDARVADMVAVCTPTRTHYDVAQKTIKDGLHTFVEKPIATTAEEGERLLRMAEEKGVVLTVGYIERFNPAVATAKELLNSGRIGEPLLLEFHRENRWPVNIKDVGIIVDTTVHDIDTARWLFDEEPKVVYARTGRVMGQFEDFATVILGFTGQKTAFIASNWITPKRVRQLSAVCTGGVISVDFITQEVRVDDESGTSIPRKPHQEPLFLELKNFVECADRGGKPLVTGRDGVVNSKIAEAALLSSRTGTPVNLNL